MIFCKSLYYYFTPSIIILLFLILFISPNIQAQNLNSRSIADRCIEFHDPKGEWSSFAYKMWFEADIADGSKVKTDIEIDNRKSYFRYQQKQNNTDIGILADSCFIVSGESDCESIKKTRNYWIYLWGLPMKLNDPGTIISPDMKEEKLDGEDCYVINVKYTKDTWYFYIRKSDYSMKAYSFIVDHEKNLGELISLDGLTKIGNMRIPSHRKWNNTHDAKYLATDHLLDFKVLK